MGSPIFAVPIMSLKQIKVNLDSLYSFFFRGDRSVPCHSLYFVKKNVFIHLVFVLFIHGISIKKNDISKLIYKLAEPQLCG